MNYTIVTGLININRDKWDNMYKRKWECYLDWLSKILRVDAPFCIYVEEENVDLVRKCREGYEHTEIVVISIEDYVLHPQLDDIKRIQGDPNYISRAVETFCPEVSIPLYDVVVNNKVEFLHQTSQKNPFGTEYFIWLDAGYGHGSIDIPNKYAWDPKLYLELAEKDTVVINTLEPKPNSEDFWGFFDAHQDFMDGGLVVANKNAISVLHTVYYEIIKYAMSIGIIDDDQYFMTMAYVKNKDLFNLVRIPGWAYRSNVLLSKD